MADKVIDMGHGSPQVTQGPSIMASTPVEA